MESSDINNIAKRFKNFDSFYENKVHSWFMDKSKFHYYGKIGGISEAVSQKCDALHELVPFVQFKKREKLPWRIVNFSKVAGPATLLN